MNLSTESKNLNEWIPANFWALSLLKYRTSKRLKKLLHKLNGGFDYSEFAERSGFSRSYIYHILKMDIAPSHDFLLKLDELERRQNERALFHK